LAGEDRVEMRAAAGVPCRRDVGAGPRARFPGDGRTAAPPLRELDTLGYETEPDSVRSPHRFLHAPRLNACRTVAGGRRPMPCPWREPMTSARP